MMVVVSNVAGKSARAQNSGNGGESLDLVPTLAPDGTVSDGAEPALPAEDSGQPKRKHRAKAAQAESSEASEPMKFGGPATSNHHFQTGISLMPGTGYRLIVRYRETQSCGDPSNNASKPICARRLPTFMDFQLAFGALARMDAIIDLRFGLEQEPAMAGSHQFVFAPGLRFWLDQAIKFKFYTTLQFSYDYTYFTAKTDVPSSDFGMRNANGLMYDPIRNVGIYLQFGETLGFRRWFRIDLDVGVGAQLRLP
jgi:hypothetical protein